MGVDYIALSFAQKAQDIQELIDLMDAEGVPVDARPDIIPKIEKPAALKNIDEILELSGGTRHEAGRSFHVLGEAACPPSDGGPVLIGSLLCTQA